MKTKTRGTSPRLPFGQLSLLLVVFLVLAYAVCYSPSKALASDHRESPTADATGRATSPTCSRSSIRMSLSKSFSS
jgi:hypothetical protein